MNYHKGIAHKIPAMASKSCNAVSSRDLYVPFGYEINVDNANRTYTVTLSACCYFGTRINVENIFHDMTIAGEPVANYTLDGWVSGTEPGKEVATLTLSGTFNPEGKPSTKDYDVSLFGTMTYYSNVGCTKTKEIPFSNQIAFSIPDIEPHYTQPGTPQINSVTSLDSAFEVSVSTTSYGEGGGKAMYVEVSKTRNPFVVFRTSNVVDTLTGTCRVEGLQRNTKYYIRAVAANNGMSAISGPMEAATLAISMFLDVHPGGVSNDRYTAVKVLTIYGGNANPVTETIQYLNDSDHRWYTAPIHTRQDEGSSWSGTVGPGNGSSSPVKRTYRIETKTAAGTYYSDAVEIILPGPRGIGGFVDNVTFSGNQITIRYGVFGNYERVTTTFYCRRAGMEDEWIELGTSSDYGTQSPSMKTKSFTKNDLLFNYVEYEFVVNVKNSTTEFDSPSYFTYTVPPLIHNDTCDSLDYLVQLICQSLNAIKQGNINVFMNDDTKKWCDDDDGVPTLASIMSRVNRFMHTVGCILCSMEGFINLLKDSTENQVFMGKLGWVDCDDEVTQGSSNPVLSGAVYAAVEDLVHQVWHYVGDYDYYAENPLELNAQSGTATGQTAVMGNKKYKWNGSSWVEDGEPVMEDFGVVHINAGRHADKAYYWFVDSWNRLDADTDEVEARLDALESLHVVTSFDDAPYVFATIADTGSYSGNETLITTTIPTNIERDTIIAITVPEGQNQRIIIYDDGNGNPRP